MIIAKVADAWQIFCRASPGLTLVIMHMLGKSYSTKASQDDKQCEEIKQCLFNNNAEYVFRVIKKFYEGFIASNGTYKMRLGEY